MMNNDLEQAGYLLKSYRLQEALNIMTDYLLSNKVADAKNADRLTRLCNDYSYMIDYHSNGGTDIHMHEVYKTFLDKAMAIHEELVVNNRITRMTFSRDIYDGQETIDLEDARIIDYLQEYATQLISLSIDDSNKNEVYDKHYHFMNSLFCSIVGSYHWTENTFSFYHNLILSQYITTNDAIHIIGAIYLSSLISFNKHKIKLLASLYSDSADDAVRQCAIVSTLMIMQVNSFDIENKDDIINTIFMSPTAETDIIETQIQIIQSMNAMKDFHMMEKDIIPSLLKTSNIEITPQGIREKKEDEMKDILSPELMDIDREEAEYQIERLQKLYKSGADIHYGAFRTMKRTAFFYRVSNWFCPFYEQHPGIRDFYGKIEDTMLETSLSKVQFCDNDLYSCVATFANMINQLPPSMQKLVNEKNVVDKDILSITDEITPTSFRRNIIRNYYRFHTLHSDCDKIASPFSEDPETGQAVIFVRHDIFGSRLCSRSYSTVASFLYSSGHPQSVLSMFDDTLPDSFTLLSIMGTILLERNKNEEAIATFQKALTIKPQSIQVRMYLAMTLRKLQCINEAKHEYEKVLIQDPENKKALSGLAFCLLNENNAEDSLPLLYKLEYNNPDDIVIKRMLAWACFLSRNVEKAETLFNYCRNSKEQTPSDTLNIGYCLWVKGMTKEAIAMFRDYLSKINGISTFSLSTISISSFYEIAIKDIEALRANSISETEVGLINDILLRE